MPAKILIPLLLILGGISWLAFTNLEKANYFYQVDELPETDLVGKPIKVKGRIVPGSIIKDQKPVIFTIAENEQDMVVHYVGEAPLPDMFKDRAETVVEGSILASGIFEAHHVQAKCASKFEAESPEGAEGYGAADYGKETYQPPKVEPRPDTI